MSLFTPTPSMTAATEYPTHPIDAKNQQSAQSIAHELRTEGERYRRYPRPYYLRKSTFDNRCAKNQEHRKNSSRIRPLRIELFSRDGSTEKAVEKKRGHPLSLRIALNYWTKSS